MPELPSNHSGSEPDSSGLPDFLNEGDPFIEEGAGFLGLGGAEAETAPPEALPSEALHNEAPLAQVTETSTEVEAEAASSVMAAEPFSDELSDEFSDEFSGEFSDELPDWALEEDDTEETMSWLMELDGTEGEEVGELDFGVPSEESGDFEPVGAPEGNNGWLLRVAIAGVSLGLGFAGARFFSQKQVQQTAPNTGSIARVERPGAATPQAGKLQPAQPRTTPAQPKRELVELGPLPPSSELEGPWRPMPTAIAPVVNDTPLAEPAGEVDVAVSKQAPATSGVGRPPTGPAPTGPAPTTAGKTGKTGTAPTPIASTGTFNRRIPGHNPRAAFTGPNRISPMAQWPPFLAMGGSEAPTSITSPTPRPSVVVTEGPGQNSPTISQPTGEVTRIVRAPEVTGLAQEDLGGSVREASQEDLSSLWLKGSIPMDRIDGKQKLMTPAVGRVRVLLLGGEIFEGELYAVGERKVWIKSELGKMALLSWQVERIEHILDPSKPGAANAPTTNLASLESVRVRTPGGVFYGRLVAQTESSVTLVTAEGARVTLHDAEVDTAGRSATHLVDASGVMADAELEQE